MKHEDDIREFGILKSLMNIKNDGRQRNVIVEYKDGRNALLPMHADENNPLPGLSDIERVTFFIDGREFEFVACQ